MTVYLTCGEKQQTIPLRLPVAAADLKETYTMLEKMSRQVGAIRVSSVDDGADHIEQYLCYADPADPVELAKLNQIAEKIATMSGKQKDIFTGALDGSHINDLDDILRIAGRLDDYLLIPNVTSDLELGRYVAVAGRINGDSRFPEEVWPYLNFAKIGAEYYDQHGGVYTDAGYVLRKKEAPVQEAENSVEPLRDENREAILTLELKGPRGPYALLLPVDQQYLDEVARYMGISDFDEATIAKLESSPAYLAELLPMEQISVEDANDLALSVEKMLRNDGELLKFCSILAVEQPENFPDVLMLDFRMDEYASVPDDAEEYGKEVLRRHGADNEIIAAIDGYMDFAEFGEDAMVENHVRRTHFGLVERLDTPFPEQDQGPQMSGM